MIKESKQEENNRPEPIEKKPISEEINELVKGYNGDLTKVEKYILGTYTEPIDLYTAGFQLAIYAVNYRLQMEQTYRDLFKNWLEGKYSLPIDPREPSIISKIVNSLVTPTVLPQELPQEVKEIKEVKPSKEKAGKSERDVLMSKVHAFLDRKEVKHE